MSETLYDLIENRKFYEVKRELDELNVVDIAAMLEELSKENMVKLFRMLKKEKAADVFAYLSSEMQQHLIEAMTDKELSFIIKESFLDDTVDLIEEMPANVVKKVLKNTDEKTRKLINQFLQYPEDSAGSLMTIEFVDLKKEMTVKQAFEKIRKTGVDKETIYTCYVTDRMRQLEGLVTAKDLLLNEEDSIIGDIMDTNVIYTHTLEDREAIVGLFRKYDLLSIPVVDNETRLVGIITIDDAVEVLEQENTEDFEIMAALTPSEKPYLKTGVFDHAKHRVGWLLVLMISATFTGAISTKFQDAFQAMPILVAFIPMLMDTGGNAGAQVSTLMIRGMALDEIHGRDVLRVWWKEIRIAVIVGAALAVVNIARIWITKKNLSLALTVGISLYITVIIAKSVGCLLPIGAKQLKLDPAIMASPIITTIVDACALASYFLIAKLILGL